MLPPKIRKQTLWNHVDNYKVSHNSLRKFFSERVFTVSTVMVTRVSLGFLGVSDNVYGDTCV